jgi:hypothetical protein
MKFKILIGMTFVAVLIGGCQQNGDSASVASAPGVAQTDVSPIVPIKTAIQAHLAHNSNLRLHSFDMELKQITVDGNHAKAQAEFHAKSGGGTMQLTYALAKRDGTWSVIESTPKGSNFSHPGLNNGQLPAAGVKRGDDSSVFQVLDKLHDRTGALAQTFPTGHPPVAASPKNKKP